MSYKLKFLPIALKEWNKLDNTIKKQLKRKLEEVIQNPKIQAKAGNPQTMCPPQFLVFFDRNRGVRH